jgi:hypothetical protein
MSITATIETTRLGMTDLEVSRIAFDRRRRRR